LPTRLPEPPLAFLPVESFSPQLLGSITALSDEYGRIDKRFAYDPWGNRAQLLDTHEGTGGALTRGFTDHEHLDDFGLIHMNGRIFDPVLARYLSADPIVQDSGDSQAYNRYSYCGNNPLNATDPSGYLTLDDVLRVVVVAVLVIAIAYSAGVAAGGMMTFNGAVAAGAAGGFTAGFVGTLAYGGGLADAFAAGIQGGIIGAITAAATYGVGWWFDQGQGIWANSYVNWTGRTLSHAVVGGLSESAQGGQFRHGFYASAFSNGIMHIKGMEGFMDVNRNSSGWSVAARTATAALIGGTAAQLSGGKFVNGAATSAMQHLFNAEMSAATEEDWMGNKRLVIVGVTEDDARKAFPDKNTTIVRVKDEKEFLARLAPDAKEHIDFKGYDRIILFGEGTNDVFTFGGKASLVFGSNVITDSSGIFTEIAKRLTGDMALVLASCKTGNTLAPAVSDLRKITVYAPTTRIGIQKGEAGLYDADVMSPIAIKAKFYKFTPKK